jgi:hypothetical protein
MLYGIKEEYLKLVEDIKDNPIGDDITELFNKVDNRTHPIAKAIKESFVNMDNGDLIGLRKSYFL